MSEIEVLRVMPTCPPVLEGRCRRCDRPRRFAATGRFRVNTNGRLADIWLLYRCDHCDATRNVAVVERVAVARLPPGLLAAAHANDPAVARRLARDPSVIRGSGMRVAGPEKWTLAAPPRPLLGEPRVGEREIVLDFDEPLLVRPAAVIAEALGVGRRELACLVAAGRARIVRPARADRLQLCDGASVVVTGRARPSARGRGER